MAKRNLDKATIAELIAMFVEGSLTPSNFLDYCLIRIKAENPRLNAVLDIYTEDAKRAAMAATTRYKSGKPLSWIDGIPIGVKANIQVEGQICHGGIKAYTENRAYSDAAVVQQLRAAGGIILCSLNMEEGALGAATDNPWFGKTHNPLRHGYTPGGSSGGSAAAVAAGLIPAALGTDTMGSVRIPSAYCGIYGIKPARGTVPMEGIMPLSTTLDTVGPHARDADGAHRILAVISGQEYQPKDKDYSGKKIGVLQWPEDMDVQDDVASVYKRFERKLARQGAVLKSVSLYGYDFSKTRRAGLLVSEVEGAHYHFTQYERQAQGFSDHFQDLLSWGVVQSREKTAKAYRLINDQAERAKDLFEDIDFLIAPTAPQTAFKFGSPVPANQADFTSFANFAGLESMSVPAGVAGNGMPVGIQIMRRV